jgi:hypothetical protein
MWRHSSLRVKSYEVGQAVDGLTAPAAYEMRVGFRWYGRHGRVLATRYRITRLCRQPDRRPDLRVGLVTTSVSSDPQNPVHYEAELYNAGLSDAGPFDTVLRSRGAIVGGPARVAGLAAQATVSVGFDGPPCTSTTAPVIAVDSGGEVSERHEGNNRVRVRCAA